MNQGWNRYLTRNVILFTIILFVGFYLVFGFKVYNVEWMLAAFIIVILIINGIYVFQNSWRKASDKNFRNKLFWGALLIRLVAMLILLAISFGTWDMFFYVGAKDEMVYYRVANEATNLWSLYGIDEAYEHIYNAYKKDISDTGFSTFLMLPVSLFGNAPVVIKILMCIIGSVSVVRAYKFAGMFFDQKTARLAGILIMLFPVSWFYSAILLKESIMVLLITEALIAITRTINRFKIWIFLLALFFIITLFFFRSAISILLIMVLGFSLFIQRKKKNVFLNIVLALAGLMVYIYFLKTTGEFEDYYEQYIGVEDFTEERVSYMKEINPFVVLAGSPVFAIVALIGPFPSVVKVPIDSGLSHSEYNYHVAGNIFYVIMAFFAIYGVYYAIRFERQKTAPIWAFAMGYQFVLLKAVMFTSVRFSYPAKPFLLILAAYGIMNLKSRKYYPLYLAVVFIMVLGWNYVRLKGRGG